MNATSETFLKLGNVYTKSRSTSSKCVALRRFKSFFGITPTVCCILWKKILNQKPQGAEPKHLLWCLNFLKQYSIEHYRRSIFGADEKTIRKWTWVFIQLLSNLNVILWEKRFNGAAPGQICFCSLDGVDFKITEPKPFNRLWFSHKFRAPGLRYEIALNIRTGDIVWAHGGYPCGQYPDLKLAREAYLLSINRGEKTMADKGYQDKQFFILPNDTNKSIHKLIMSRHETVNKRLRQFQVLKQTFRNNIIKHPTVFQAVANVTQLMFENGEPLFTILGQNKPKKSTTIQK